MGSLYSQSFTELDNDCSLAAALRSSSRALTSFQIESAEIVRGLTVLYFDRHDTSQRTLFSRIVNLTETAELLPDYYREADADEFPEPQLSLKEVAAGVYIGSVMISARVGRSLDHEVRHLSTLATCHRCGFQWNPQGLLASFEEALMEQDVPIDTRENTIRSATTTLMTSIESGEVPISPVKALADLLPADPRARQKMLFKLLFEAREDLLIVNAAKTGRDLITTLGVTQTKELMSRLLTTFKRLLLQAKALDIGSLTNESS